MHTLSLLVVGGAVVLVARTLPAQYIVPATPLSSSASMPSAPFVLDPVADPVDFSIGFRLAEPRQPKLWPHVIIGAAAGGVAGYAFARTRTGGGGDNMFPEGLGHAFGAVTGAAAGALVGTLVWAMRKPPRTPTDSAATTAPPSKALRP